MPLKVICSECGKKMGEKPGGEGISDGICPTCFRKRMIEDVLADGVEAQAVAMFGLAPKDFSQPFQFVLRDGTMIGSGEFTHYAVCSIDEILEYALLTDYEGLIHDERSMTLEEARAKWPGMNNCDIADRRWSGATIEICPISFMRVTGAARTGDPLASSRFFQLFGMPTIAQSIVMERALKILGSIEIEILRGNSNVLLELKRPTQARGIRRQLERKSADSNLAGTTGKIPTLTSAKVLEEKAVEEFGITEDPLMAGYLLKDGRFLDFSGGSGMRAFDHRQVEGLFSDQEIDFTRPMMGGRTQLIWEFMARTGAIRLTPEGCAAESPITFPTRNQARSLNDYAIVCQGTVLLETWHNGNPRRKLSGFFAAGDVDAILRVSKMMEAHPERFGGKRQFVIGKSSWGLKGLNSVCRTSFDALHSHGYHVDALGNGETTTDMLHHHDIVYFEVLPGGIITHGHRLIGHGECLMGVPHLGQLDHDLVEEWLTWARTENRVVTIPVVAHWILEDGVMIELPMSHDDICWGLLPERIAAALERALLDQFGYEDHLAEILEEDPEEDASEVRRAFIHDLTNSGVAKDWCEGMFIAMTGAIRHASRAFPTVVPTFEGPVPNLAQAVQIAKEIEDRRPNHSGALVFLDTNSGRTLPMMFPARATASSVIAKLERALEGDDPKIDAFLGQVMPKVGAGDGPAELAVKTHGLSGAKNQGHVVPHLSGIEIPDEKKAEEVEDLLLSLTPTFGLTDKFKRAGFLFRDGRLLNLQRDTGGFLSHRQAVRAIQIQVEEGKAPTWMSSIKDVRMLMLITGAIRLVNPCNYQTVTMPTPSQIKVLLDGYYNHAKSHCSPETMFLEFVRTSGPGKVKETYVSATPSEKEIRAFGKKADTEGGLHRIPHLGELRQIAPTAGLKSTSLAARAGFVMPDGQLLDIFTKDGRRRAHYELVEEATERSRKKYSVKIGTASEALFSDKVDSVHEWMARTGAIRIAFPGTIEVLTRPTETQYLFFEEEWAKFPSSSKLVFVDLMTDTTAHRSTRLSANEVAGGALRDFVSGKIQGRVERTAQSLGEIEPSIDLQIIGIVDELISRRETPKIEAVKSAARDLQEKIEKLADEAGVEVRFAEGAAPGPTVEAGLIAVDELEEKVNVVRLRPATRKEKDQWAEDKRKIAREMKFTTENPFVLPKGEFILESIDALEGTFNLLERTMSDNILDWLERLGHYPQHIKVELRITNRPDITAELSKEEGPVPLEKTRWKLQLSSAFPMQQPGGGLSEWKSAWPIEASTEDINWVMSRFSRPGEGLQPNVKWPVGMIENFNNAWDALVKARTEWRMGQQRDDVLDGSFMFDIFDHHHIGEQAWILAAMYVPTFGASRWFAAERSNIPGTESKLKLPDLFSDKAKDDRGVGWAKDINNTVYLNNDWPVFISPVLARRTPGNVTIEEAFAELESTDDKDRVNVILEIGHYPSGTVTSFPKTRTFAWWFPAIIEQAVCILEQILRIENVGIASGGWHDVNGKKDVLLRIVEAVSPGSGEDFILSDFVSRLANATIGSEGPCGVKRSTEFLGDKGRPWMLGGVYEYPAELPANLEFWATPFHSSLEPQNEDDDLEGLGEMPTASDIVTSIVAHLQAIANDRLEIDVAKGQDAAIDSLLRSIKMFTTRLQASCSCDTGFEWCCPPGRRVLPRPPISKSDEDDLSGIRSQLQRLGGYAEEGIELTPIHVSGRDEIMLKLTDRAGQFTYRGKPADIRRQLSNISSPPDTGRLWKDTQIRSFWYVLASNERFKLDETGWRWALEAPLEFFGAQFISRSKKYHGLVLTNYEWALTSSQFLPTRPDTIIHIGTGVDSQAFLPTLIFDKERETDPKVQLGIMRCIALEVNSMVPDGLINDVKVLKHVQFGSAKVTGKDAETYKESVDNLADACEDVVDTLPSKQQRSVTFKGLHGIPSCLLGSCEVKNG